MTRLKLFLLILAVNTLLAALYLLWNLLFRKKEKKRNYWNRGIVMLLCPVAGIVFFLLAQVWYLLFFSKPVDLEDVIFSKDRARAFLHAEEDRERNLVPLEEAIAVTDRGELRELMMNVVRGDIQKSLAAIALAMNSEDTETAHYAASVLQDALNEFRANVQKQRQLIFQEDEYRLNYAETLIEYMDHVLAQRVFTDLEQKDYIRQMEEICELLFTEGRGRMKSNHYEAVSLRLLEIESFEECEKWCLRAAGQYPNTLATYSCLLKLYFSSRQKEKFFRTMKELQSSNVVIDRETLELIRVFL